MPGWLSYLAAFVALVLLAPLLAWLGHKHGRSLKGGIALASVLLGFGLPLDPPTARVIEANESKVKRGDESGDPPDPDVARAKRSDG